MCARSHQAEAELTTTVARFGAQKTREISVNIVKHGVYEWTPARHPQTPPPFQQLVFTVLLLGAIESVYSPECPWYLLPNELRFQVRCHDVMPLAIHAYVYTDDLAGCADLCANVSRLVALKKTIGASATAATPR